MLFRILQLAVVASTVSACGVKFADQTVDTSLPADYTNRTRIANTADYRFNMQQNIGAVLEADAANPGQYRLASVSVIRPPGYTIKEQILANKDNQVYNGKITAGGSVSGNYAVVGVSLSASQAAEISIVDVARAEIETPDIPVDLLRQYAKTKGPNKQYWVKSLLLSRILKQIYTEESANASGSGPAFGASGKVYHTTSTQQTDFNLAAVLIDIDSYKDQPPNPVAGLAAAPAPGATVVSVNQLKGVPKSQWTDAMIGVVKLAPICAQPRLASGARGTVSSNLCPQ